MITIKVGDEEFTAQPGRTMLGKFNGWRVVLARSEDRTTFVSANVGERHMYGCACTRLGKKSGPCNCGAEDLLRQIADKAGVVFDLGGRHPEYVEMEQPAGPAATSLMRVAPESVAVAESEGWTVRSAD